MPEAIQQFIITNLGKKYVESVPLDLQAAYDRSTPTTPLIFIISAGSNPMDEILKLAAKSGMSKRVEIISFGQQQGPIAEKAIENGECILL